MKTDKLERLQAAGWKVGSTEGFLQLSDEEAQLVALMYGICRGLLGNRCRRSRGVEFPALEASNTTPKTVTNG